MKKVLLAIVLAASLVAEQFQIRANLVVVPTITQTELAFIYKGKIRHWSTGERIMVVVRPPESAVQQHLIKDILHVSTSTFHEYVARNSSLKVVDDRDVVKTMMSKIGAVGLVDNMVLFGLDDTFVVVEIIEGF
jgi:ABC-type phosphate transport system substrate-binding protein